MAESLTFTANADRETLYREVLPQIEALTAGESDLTANLANIAAVLKQAFGFFWVGFYLVRGEQLVLGPFQGPLACTRIDRGRGVCGHAWETRQTVIVPDVDEFPGHIACNSDARSEIVVPLIGRGGDVIGVIDVDSDVPDNFGRSDADGLERLARIVENLFTAEAAAAV